MGNGIKRTELCFFFGHSDSSGTAASITVKVWSHFVAVESKSGEPRPKGIVNFDRISAVQHPTLDDCARWWAEFLVRKIEANTINRRADGAN